MDSNSSEPTTRIRDLREFYGKELGSLRGPEGKIPLILVAIALVLFILIGTGLDATPEVWLFLVIVFGVLWIFSCQAFFKVVSGLRDASRDLFEALTSVEESSGPEAREKLSAFLRKRESPTDKSNVPEVLSTVLSDYFDPGNSHSRAESAFLEVVAPLERLSFLRSAMVLAGLFGTVLFFALSLTSPTAAGLPADLFPGLRGALTSTLTGILSAILIGFGANRLSGRLWKLVQETEVLLSGALPQILQIQPTQEEAGSERAMWTSVQSKLSKLIISLEDRETKFADHVDALSTSYQVVLDGVRNLPQVQLPDQINKLDRVIEAFGKGMEQLHKSVIAMVSAMESVGVSAPVETLEEVRGFSEAMVQWRGGADKLLEEVSAAAIQAGKAADQTRSRGDEFCSAVEKEIGELSKGVGNLKVDLATLSREVPQTVSTGLKKASTELMDGFSKTQTTVAGMLTQLGTVGVAVSGIQGEVVRLEAMQTDIADLSRQILELQGDLGAIDFAPSALTPSQQEELSDVAAWTRRISRSPVLRLLTAPLFPRRR